VQGLERRARNGASAQGGELSGQLERTVDHVKRLARLVEDLVDVSNILAGKLTVRREPVDLAEVVRGVAHRLEVPRARSGSTLALDAPPGCVGAWDHARLDQVIANLLGNAIKYGAGKPIEISLEATPERVTLVVRDHGIGIDDGARARLFGRFQRAVASKHYGGFGVGLWTVKQIVNALNGEVRLDSAPDAGTSIVVVLPRGEHVPGETELRPRERGRPRETGSSAASGMH
jgi:signal transduction histidine kinase